jgi:Crinkler effector protein N-terminal domain
MIMTDKIHYNKVYCLVQGDSKPFSVTLRDGDVADLKKLIQEQRQHGILHNIDSVDLVLWKVGIFNAQYKLADFLLVAP